MPIDLIPTGLIEDKVSVSPEIGGVGYKFKVGDRVVGKDGNEFFRGVVSHVNDNTMTVNRDDGMRGSGKDNHWEVAGNIVGKNSYDVVLDKSKVPQKKIKANKSNTIYAQLSRRKNGKTYFTFSVPEKITETYKVRGAEVKTSKSWVGLQFYAIPELISDDKYKRNLRSYNLFDDYGDGFVKIDGGTYKLNIAWIRTVGGSGEFEVKNEIGHGELNLLMENMLTFLKNYFEDFYRSFTIKGSLTIDF